MRGALQSVMWMLTAQIAATGPLTAAPNKAEQGGAVIVHRIAATLANEMVGLAVSNCAQMGYQVSAVVIDIDGVRQAQLRGDGAGIHTLDSSFYKAYTAVTFQTDTIELLAQSAEGPVSSSFSRVPMLLLAQGGVVIKIGNETVGAIGVGGAPGHDYDTQCGRTALAKVRERLR